MNKLAYRITNRSIVPPKGIERAMPLHEAFIRVADDVQASEGKSKQYAKLQADEIAEVWGQLKEFYRGESPAYDVGRTLTAKLAAKPGEASTFLIQVVSKTDDPVFHKILFNMFEKMGGNSDQLLPISRSLLRIVMNNRSYED